jgi:hypothetical protein
MCFVWLHEFIRWYGILYDNISSSADLLVGLSVSIEFAQTYFMWGVVRQRENGTR